MIEAFDVAVIITLFQEGGLADDKDDPGGITHYGISLRYAQSLGVAFFDINHDGKVDADDIRQMPVEAALRAYREDWWLRYGYDKLPIWAGAKALSISVNMGPKPTHKALQLAVGANPIDGVIGPATIIKANAADPIKAAQAFREAIWAEYQSRIQLNPVLSKYSGGWRARAAF